MSKPWSGDEVLMMYYLGALAIFCVLLILANMPLILDLMYPFRNRAAVRRVMNEFDDDIADEEESDWRFQKKQARKREQEQAEQEEETAKKLVQAALSNKESYDALMAFDMRVLEEAVAKGAISPEDANALIEAQKRLKEMQENKNSNKGEIK